MSALAQVWQPPSGANRRVAGSQAGADQAGSGSQGGGDLVGRFAPGADRAAVTRPGQDVPVDQVGWLLLW
jgi:hypothetical protein